MARRTKKKTKARPTAPSRWRTRAVVCVIAFVAVWPLVHRGLVAAYDVNPWRLAGWAMYTTPMPPVLVVAFEPRGEDGVPIDQRTLPLFAQQVLLEFRRNRHALGNLLRPDDFAAQVLEARTDLTEVVILVQRMVLDPGTAHMKARTMHYRYGRGGLLSEQEVAAAGP